MDACFERIIVELDPGVSRECFRVVVDGDTYVRCVVSSYNRWSNKKKGTFGRGIANTKKDPSRVERMGMLGEAAVGIVFRKEPDYDYKELGDKLDFPLLGKTADVKCCMPENKNCMVVRIRCETENRIPIAIDKDIYIAAYCEEETPFSAVIVLTAWHRNKDVQACQSVQAPAGHWNKEPRHSKGLPIATLYNLVMSESTDEKQACNMR
jgi:hypothetical protein